MVGVGEQQQSNVPAVLILSTIYKDKSLRAILNLLAILADLVGGPLEGANIFSFY